jgi:HPt (histidine-containing phosphotransfer) domain-containing protein
MSSKPPSNPEPPGLAEALDRLWRQFLPQMYDRVAVLDTAVAPLATGALAEAHRNAVAEAAHNLAGIMGSFGLPEGTVLAREAESICAEHTEAAPAAAARVAQIAMHLRYLIETRR